MSILNHSTLFPPFDLKPLNRYWVWFDVLTEEVLALPCSETTSNLLNQLNKEGVTPKEVLARNAYDARRLGCPEYFKKSMMYSSIQNQEIQSKNTVPKFH